MKNYLDIIFNDKYYIQRTENSKIKEIDIATGKTNTYLSYDELPWDVDSEINNIIELNDNLDKYFQYSTNDDGTITITKFYNNLEVRNVTIPEYINEKKVVALENTFFMDSRLQRLIIPNTINELRGSICQACTELQEVILPENIKIIPENAFHCCHSLTKINLENIEEIKDNAFRLCTELTDINLQNLIFVGMMAFMDCYNITKIDAPNLRFMSNEAFRSCTRLREITFSEECDALERGVFIECCELEKINLPNTIEKIKDKCFFGCKKITNLNFPKNLVEIGELAFAYSGLNNEITFPEKLEKIKEEAFRNCSFTRINISKNTQTYSAFDYEQQLKINTYDTFKNKFKNYFIKER